MGTLRRIISLTSLSVVLVLGFAPAHALRAQDPDVPQPKVRLACPRELPPGEGGRVFVILERVGGNLTATLDGEAISIPINCLSSNGYRLCVVNCPPAPEGDHNLTIAGPDREFTIPIFFGRPSCALGRDAAYLSQILDAGFPLYITNKGTLNQLQAKLSTVSRNVINLQVDAALAALDAFRSALRVSKHVDEEFRAAVDEFAFTMATCFQGDKKVTQTSDCDFTIRISKVRRSGKRVLTTIVVENNIQNAEALPIRVNLLIEPFVIANGRTIQSRLHISGISTTITELGTTTKELAIETFELYEIEMFADVPQGFEVTKIGLLIKATAFSKTLGFKNARAFLISKPGVTALTEFSTCLLDVTFQDVKVNVGGRPGRLIMTVRFKMVAEGAEAEQLVTFAARMNLTVFVKFKPVVVGADILDVAEDIKEDFADTQGRAEADFIFKVNISKLYKEPEVRELQKTLGPEETAEAFLDKYRMRLSGTAVSGAGEPICEGGASFKYDVGFED